MADEKTNQPLIGGDSENFMRLMNRALTRIEQVDAATAKANASLNNYAKSFDELNSRLERYVKLSGNAKSGKFNRITITERTETTGGSRGKSRKSRSDDNSPSDNPDKYAQEAKKLTDNIMNTIFRSIDNIGGQQARVITSTFKKITNTVIDAKKIGSGVKQAQNMAKAQKAAAAASGEASAATAGASATALTASAVVAGVALALVAMGAAGKYAYERNMDVNRSLMMMGDTANEMTSSSSKTANQMISIKNTWTRIGDDLAGVFEPVFTLIIDFVDTISKAIEFITSPLDKDNQKQYTSSDSKARWYTKNLENISGEPENKSLPVIGGIASTAKQSGFDNTSAANLAIGTYDLAMKKARQYGVEASEVAQKLADAWTTGSDAAKEYGVVVDDQTLIGYMASKGVDIVNTQISDAMKQYYRYDLMQTELNANSNDAMQNQIKQWKQLGMQIDITKQKLFSFDEVIQLSALNTEIPTVGTPSVSYPNSDGTGGNNVTSGVLPPVIGGGGATPGTSPSPAPSPVTVPVVYEAQNDWVLSPSPVPVNIPVTVPGLDLVGDLVYELGLVWGLLPLPVTVPVSVPGLETLPTLEELLNAIKGLVPVAVSLPVTVPGFELAPQLLTYCTQLSAAPFMSTVLFTIPALALAPTLLGYLLDMAKNWAVNVSVSVAGMNLLSQAQTLLQRVLSLAQQAGQALATSTSTSLVKSGASKAYSAAKGYVTNSDSWSIAIKQEGYSTSDINTAKSMAKKNGVNWNSLSSYQRTQYVKVADVVNDNIMITQADGIEMLNNYNTTGKATSSKVNWMNTTGTDIANQSLKVAGVLGTAGVTLLTAGLAAPLLEGAGAAVSSWLSGLSGAAAAFGMATGGIGTKETTIRAFEGDKKEAVIPLETQAGVDYLASAMRQANAGEGMGNSGSIQVYLTLSGVNIADNDAQWQKVGEKIAEVIEVQRQRRGDLNYGGSF